MATVIPSVVVFLIAIAIAVFFVRKRYLYALQSKKAVPADLDQQNFDMLDDKDQTGDKEIHIPDKNDEDKEKEDKQGKVDTDDYKDTGREIKDIKYE